MRKTIAEVHPELLIEWSDKNDPLSPADLSYGSNKYVWWHGPCGHTWSATPKSRHMGNGCPYCAHRAVLAGFNDLASQRPTIASEWSEKNLPLTPDQVAVFCNQRAYWRCKNGHTWYARISDRSNGSQCPYCSGAILKGFNDLATTRPDLALEWSEKNDPLNPDMITEKYSQSVWWKCLVCDNEWTASVSSRSQWDTKCPVCSGRAVLPGHNDLLTTDPVIAAEWDFEKNQGLAPSAVSRSSWKWVHWKCALGHSWSSVVRDRTISGKTCPECEKTFLLSLPQLATALYAKETGFKAMFHTEEPLDLPVSAFVPELNLIIDTETASPSEQVKSYLCSKHDLTYVNIPDAWKHAADEILETVREAYRSAHVYIQPNDAEDAAFLRRFFEQKALSVVRRLKPWDGITSFGSLRQEE